MENIIAVTACLKRCSIAIAYENNVYEINENVDAAANLVYFASELIKMKNIDLKKIEGVITASGPGSFTGIRVAQSFAKGVAMSLKIPSASVSYFDVIKSRFFAEKILSNDVVVIIKSEKEQIYYEITSPNCSEIGISACDALNNLLTNKILLLGDAINEVGPYLKDKIIDAHYIDDFRDAKYLLNFAEMINKESQIRPLYVNVKSKY